MAQIDLTNETGKKMLGWVAPIYDNSLVMKIIYQALGTEWENVEDWISDIKAQFWPQTATWSLVYWEDSLSLPKNNGASYAVRRAAILAKILESRVVNPARLRKSIEMITGIATAIVPNIAPYTFGIRCRTLDADMEAAVRVLVERLKPAHMSYEFQYILNSWYDVKQFTWADIAAMDWKKVKEEVLVNEV